MYGKLFADKGYISQKLFDFLFEDGIQLVTGLRVNMKNKLMPFYDRMMLRKRYIIETILYIQPVSDGMGREFTYLSSHATNRYFIPNWGCILKLLPLQGVWEKLAKLELQRNPQSFIYAKKIRDNTLLTIK